MTPLPANEDSQAIFATHLSKSIHPWTIQPYRSVVRFLHLRVSLPELPGTSSLRLNYAKKGIQSMSPSFPKLQHLPITQHLLERNHPLWSMDQPSFDTTMLWATFWYFFCFIWSREFTCYPSGKQGDCALTVSDVKIDVRTNPQVLRIYLRRTQKK